MPTALQTKVLGLPAWAWGAIIGGGVLVVGYLRHRSGAGSGGDEVDTEGAPLDPTGAADDSTYDPTGQGLADGSDRYLGNLPPLNYGGGGDGGFNYSGPPPAPSPNLRTDPRVLRNLRLIEKHTRPRPKQRAKKRSGHPIATSPGAIRNPRR